MAESITVRQNLAQLWNRIVGQVARDSSNTNLEIFLAGSRPISLHEGTLYVEFPNKFFRDWVETRHIGQLQESLFQIAGETWNLRLVTRDEMNSDVPRAARPATVTPIHTSRANDTEATRPRAGETSTDTPSVPAEAAAPVAHKAPRTPMKEPEPVASQSLNPKYTFDTFVVGSGNRFAHAASLATASEPAGVYNPLFLYGGVGLGKTHLMQAIGHYVLKHHKHMHVVYVSSERFTNDLINSLQEKKMVEFRQRYRNVDVLLIDDIQFIAGKESTQEEFFHTFNALYQANKQIVISSDRPPKEIPTLEDRLRSRFECGLIADIQAPDLETRVAILRQKAMSDQIDVPDEVLDLIATNIQSNIRELEGALNRVMAYASLQQTPISVHLAAEALKEIISSTKARPITIASIQEHVANHFGVKLVDLKGKRRSRAIVYPRQIAMFLARELTDASLPRIGEEFGGRDHTTVMHACDKIRKEQEEDTTLAATIRSITARVHDQG